MLIGVEMFPKILLSNRIQLNSKCPTMQEFIFGWLIFGTYEVNTCNNFHLKTQITNIQIDNSLKKFWDIEEIPQKRYTYVKRRI